MEARLLPLNAVLALASAGGTNPAPLAAAGFRVAALEVPVGIGANRVVIDVLLTQERTGLLIACEAKSGANIDATQAAKYVSLDAQAVVLAGSVDLPDGVRPTVGVLYACQTDHVARIGFGLGRAGVAVPILAVDRAEVRLFHAEQAPESLGAALGSGPMGMPAGIPRIIPCDHESPLEVVRPQVRAVLVAHLSRRTPQVAAQVIAHVAVST